MSYKFDGITGIPVELQIALATAAGGTDSPNIADNAVVAAKIAADAVITTKILDLNVTTGKINDLAVTVGKLDNLAVQTAKLDNLAVTTGKIAALAVNTSKLAVGVISADAPGRALFAAGVLDAATVDSIFATNTIGQELLEAELDGASAANTANPDGGGVTTNQISLATEFVISHADHATETLVYKTTRKIEILDVEVICDAAGAANTVALTDAADAAITDVMACAVAKTITRAATIDVAKRIVAAGATFKVVFTRAAGSSLCTVRIRCALRA